MSAKSQQVRMEAVQAATIDAMVAEEAAAEVMAAVVENSTDLMLSNHFDRLSIPYTVRSVTREVLDFIQLAFVGQDDGSTVREHWHADPQPGQVVVDPWARAALNVQPPKKRDTEVPIGLATGGAAERRRNNNASRAQAPSKKPSGKESPAATSPSIASPTSDAGAKPSGSQSAFAGAAKTTKPKAAKSATDKIESAENTQNDGEKPPSSGEPFLSSEEIEYANKVKLEAKHKQDAKQLTERLSKQMEELKGAKDVVVDSLSGKVVAVKSLDTNGAFKNKSEPKVNISGPPESVQQQNLAPVKPPANTRGGAKPGASTKRSKRDTQADFFSEDNTGGPMIEMVLPTGGVTLRDTDGSIKKSELKNKKPTRQDVKKMAETAAIDLDPNSGIEGLLPSNKPSADIPQQQPMPKATEKKESPVTSVTTPNPTGDFKTQSVAHLPQQKMVTGPGAKKLPVGNKLPSMHQQPPMPSPLPGNTSPSQVPLAMTSTHKVGAQSPRQLRNTLAKSLATSAPAPHRPHDGVTQHAALDDGYLE